MGIKELIEVTQSEAVFAVLFVGLLYFVLMFVKNLLQELREMENKREEQLIELYREQKTESALREKELLKHLEALTEQQAEIVEALKSLRNETRIGLEKLEEKVDRRFIEVWKSINNQ